MDSKVSKAKLLLCSFLVWPVLFLAENPSLLIAANTYYIDFNAADDRGAGTKSDPWKRAPGMNGFAGGYTHQAGDTFIFKGGVTWPAATLPLTISYSGAAGNVSTYSAESSWYIGSGWSQPTLDGGNSVDSGIIATSQSYFKVNDLRIVNIGAAQTVNSKKALDIQNCHHVTFSNMTVAAETWLGFYVYLSTSGTRQSVTITGNDISHAGQAIVVATAAANAIYDGVDISHNTIHDLSSQIGGGVHGDGIHTWGQTTDNTQYIENLRIYGNLFHGDFHRSFGTTGGMTAFIYVSDATTGAWIYNNVGSYTDSGTSQFEAMISLRGNTGRGGGHKVFNNSFRGTRPGMSAAILLADGTTNAVPNCEIKNNIFSGMQYVYYVTQGSNTGLSIDYNDANCADSSAVGYWLSSFKSWAQWQALGNDINGLHQDPLFLSPSDLRLQFNSPAKDKGVNLSSYFSSDQDGVSRPQGSAWDMGAYEYVSSIHTLPPSSPRNLRIR